MKDSADSRTLELVDPVKRGRGRPSGDVPALTGAQRQALHRQRLKEVGLVQLSVMVPAELAQRLDEFLKFKDETKDQALARALQAFLRKR